MGRAHFIDGVGYRLVGDLLNAEASFDRAARLAPDEPVTHYELASTRIGAWRFHEVLDALRQVQRMEPADKQLERLSCL